MELLVKLLTLGLSLFLFRGTSVRRGALLGQ
jgi:hypothetical protein